jgi:protein SCO1/2
LSAATEGKPVVLIFADYTCSTLCGPIVSLLSNDLANSGLRAGEDYRVVVIGIDPKDKIADANAMKKAQLAPALSRASAFLTGSEQNIQAATAALGYHYSYDPAHDQFAHSAAVYVLQKNGQVSRVLNGLSSNARDLRLALVAASQGAAGNFRDQVQLICYGFDPAKGTYSIAVSRVLFAACCSTVLGLAAIIGFLVLGGSTRKA